MRGAANALAGSGSGLVSRWSRAYRGKSSAAGVARRAATHLCCSVGGGRLGMAGRGLAPGVHRTNTAEGVIRITLLTRPGPRGRSFHGMPVRDLPGPELRDICQLAACAFYCVIRITGRKIWIARPICLTDAPEIAGDFVASEQNLSEFLDLKKVDVNLL